MPGLFGIAFDHELDKRTILIRDMSVSLNHHNSYKTKIYENDQLTIGNIGLDEPPLFLSDRNCKILVYGYCNTGQVDNTDLSNLLSLYLHHGEGFVKHLRGVFNLVLWDSTKKELLISNDRFGLHPLYYARSDERFIFACEVKAILADKSIGKTIDLSAVADFFSFGFILENKTFFEDNFEIYQWLSW